MMTLRDRLGGLTIGMAARMFTGIGTALALTWMLAGPVVKPLAAEAFVEMLKQQGMDPKDFADIQKKAVEIDKKTDELARDNDLIRGDLNTVKQSIGKLSNDIQSQNAQSNRVESLVNQLLQLQLRRAQNQ